MNKILLIVGNSVYNPVNVVGYLEINTKFCIKSVILKFNLQTEIFSSLIVQYTADFHH